MPFDFVLLSFTVISQLLSRMGFIFHNSYVTLGLAVCSQTLNKVTVF
jgi:hypothetical protein